MDFNPHLVARVQFVGTADNALALDHNPLLKPWLKPSPNNVAGKGKVFDPGKAENVVWQNRAAPPTEYENAMGDALEKVFESGATTLDEVVAGLNALAFRASDGGAWTAPRFEAEIARLAG